jgi:predicted nucleic acid-binding protein
VLLDTDVLIDLALDRSPYAQYAAELLDTLENRPRSSFVSWHTVANFYYLVTPTRGGNSTKAFLLDLTRFIEVAPATTQGLRYAAELPLKDFEDAMQVAAAEACGADVIATRNVRDYAKAPVRAVTPQTLLGELR